MQNKHWNFFPFFFTKSRGGGWGPPVGPKDQLFPFFVFDGSPYGANNFIKYRILCLEICNSKLNWSMIAWPVVKPEAMWALIIGIHYFLRLQCSSRPHKLIPQGRCPILPPIEAGSTRHCSELMQDPNFPAAQPWYSLLWCTLINFKDFILILLITVA